MEHVGYVTSASEVDLRPISVRTSTYLIFQETQRVLRRGMTYGWDTVRTPANRTLVIDFGGTELLDERFSTVDRRDNDWYGNGRFGAVPASEAEIAKLPVTMAGEVRETDCGVCLERLEEGEGLRKMTCPSSHGFHESCIFKWLRVSRLCPLCRFALPAEQEERRTTTEPEAEETDMEGDTEE